MKVIVLGAGIIGVTSAYYLAKQGHEVIVLDKSSGSAEGCSFANGGQLSYSHIETWSNSAFIKNMLKSLVSNNSFININDYSNKDFYNWILKFTKNSLPRISLINSLKLHKICSLSKNLMTKILDEELILEKGRSFNYNKSGILHFYRKKNHLDKSILKLKKYQDLNIKFKILNPNECLEKESSFRKLISLNKLAGGIYFPDDASGDCLKFTNKLEKICREKYSVKFIYDCHIKNIFTNYKRITGINTDDGVFVADKYLYSLGAISQNLLNGIKINTSMYPIKGYSISINDNENVISSNTALTDNENKIVFSKLNNILRVAGAIEINKIDSSLQRKNLNFLYQILNKTFDIRYDKSQVTEWQGFRPFRANSIPLIGRVNQLENMYINTGHGSMGWTNSLGSGKIISEIISDKTVDDYDFLSDEFTNLFKGQ